jgi:SNF2 family DNA or RNA helicase
VPLLCGHPGQFGHGIDGLQLGCRRMAFLGLPWSHDAYVQTVGRLNRSGQTKPVFIHLFHTPGSIDDAVRAAVDEKQTTESAMIAAIKKLR